MVRLMELTRPDCCNAAMILSSSSGDGGTRSEVPPYCTLIGRAGQQSRVFKTGVPYVQWSRRFRLRGDVNMICRHPWQTHVSIGQIRGVSARQ